MRCLKCGSENNAEANFCRKCGNKLETAEEYEQRRIREAEENERRKLRAEEQRKASLLEQERITEARKKQFELWRERLWRYRAVVGGILLSLAVGGGYWYYQKVETEKAIALQKQQEEEQRLKAEAEAEARTKAEEARRLAAKAHLIGVWKAVVGGRLPTRTPLDAFEKTGIPFCGCKYLKITKVGTSSFKLTTGFDSEGKVNWTDPQIKSADGIYMKLIGGKLTATFVSPNFYATHGQDFTFTVTNELNHDNELLFSVSANGETERARYSRIQ